MSTSPEKRTRDLFRSNGYIVDGVNRYEAYSGRRHDFIGCVDLIAFNDEETIAIQATSASNRAARRKKLLGNEDAKRWLASGHRKLYLVTWGLRKPRGETRPRWKENIEEIRREDFL